MLQRKELPDGLRDLHQLLCGDRLGNGDGGEHGRLNLTPLLFGILHHQQQPAGDGHDKGTSGGFGGMKGAAKVGLSDLKP